MYRWQDTLAKTAGRFGLTWGRDLTDQMETLSYEEGKRERRVQSRSGIPAGEPETFGEAFDAAFGDSTFGRTNRLLAKLGAAGGFGYGVWLVVGGSGGSGLGAIALTVAKWTAIGGVGGALFLMALVAAASVAFLLGILAGLGLLLNVVAG